MAENNARTRNWAMIVYPESAPENWREIIDELHIPWIVSPLHDQDVNPDGTPKKPHWHVILVFDNVKAFHQVEELTEKINAPIPQPCSSLRGYVRYLVHTDNPEKHQYSRADIENHGVDDLDKYFQTASSTRAILKACMNHIHEDHVTNYMDLCLWAASRGDDWFDVVTSRTILLTALVNGEYQQVSADNWDSMSHDHTEEDSEADKMSKLLQAQKMQRKGYKQAEIADTLGVSVRTVKRYLNGK